MQPLYTKNNVTITLENSICRLDIDFNCFKSVKTIEEEFLCSIFHIKIVAQSALHYRTRKKNKTRERA